MNALPPTNACERRSRFGMRPKSKPIGLRAMRVLLPTSAMWHCWHVRAFFGSLPSRSGSNSLLRHSRNGVCSGNGVPLCSVNSVWHVAHMPASRMCSPCFGV